MKTMISALGLSAVFFLSPVLAQSMQSGHGSHGGPGGHGAQTQAAAANAAAMPSTKAYVAANDKMHRDMEVHYTGDADVDFLMGMIPHHQAAVEMAKIVLQYGKDPKVNALAQQIIADQEKEIALMQDLLKQLRR
jgi:uncharacterized protein (DUF305 family)